MDRFDYLIVGAGFAGSVCAEQLASAGKRVLLIDQRNHIGGNAYDYYDEAGILVHKYGAHVFHTNSWDVFAYLSRFTDWRGYEHRVLASVDGRLVPVPINRTTLAAFGGDEAKARQALIEPYTRKQWGAWAGDLLPSVLARIQTRDSDDDRYFTDTYQAMPKHGYTRLFERMLAHPNIKLLLNTSYRDALALFDFTASRQREYFGVPDPPYVICTGPIDEFFDYRFGRLPYRSATFRFETFHARGARPQQHQPVAVVNWPSEAVPHTRVIEFKHLTGQAHWDTTIAYECPGMDGDPFWPVPTAASAALYRRYADLAATISGLHFVGRLGTYRYYDMHAVVAQALTLCGKIIQGKEVGSC